MGCDQKDDEVITHQYLTKENDGWYLRRQYANGERFVYGPYRWEWWANLVAMVPI